MPSEEQLLLGDRPSTQGQRRSAIFLALSSLAAFLACIPHLQTQLPEYGAVVPIVDSLLLLCLALIATLLIVQAFVLRSRSIMALASGCLFAAALVLMHALASPGALSPTGVLGSRTSTSLWLYFFWHAGLSLAVIAYALLKPIDQRARVSRRQSPQALWVCPAGCLLLAATLGLLSARTGMWLPALTIDADHWLPERVIFPGAATLALLGVALTLVSRKPRSVFDLSLMLALWIWLLGIVLVSSADMAYSTGWYAGRIAGLSGGAAMLVMLLAETSRSQARLALAITQQHREREGRMLTVNAVAASIAHEARQPLTAIVADASTARVLLRRDVVDREELEFILNAIEAEGQRAAETVASIRGMFTHRLTEKSTVDVRSLVREATEIIGPELAASSVSLRLELDAVPAPVLADRRQLQQVVLNLCTNAVEAMAASDDRSRELTLRVEQAGGEKVRLSVEDSGPGFAPEIAAQLFDSFFTTKPNGNGIGLSLCREIVELHGGRVLAETRAPHGATFRVELPLHAATAV